MGKRDSSRVEPWEQRMNRGIAKHQVAWNGGNEPIPVSGSGFIQKVTDGLKEGSKRASRLGHDIVKSGRAKKKP